VENDPLESIAANRYTIAGIPEIFSAIQSLSSFRKWKGLPSGICFYGWSQYSRNIQLHGFAGACATLGIPFYVIYKERAKDILSCLKNVHNLIVITYIQFLPELESFIKRAKCHIVLMWQYYDDTPDPLLATPIGSKEKEILKGFRKDIHLVLSELSLEGNQRFMSGYVRDFGIPVMTFPWAVNIDRHFPVNAAIDKDVFFIGTYCEKAARIEEYFGKVLRRYAHTVIGPDWSRSTLRWMEDSIMQADEFHTRAPSLYSSHTVSLNIHLPFEASGYSCNERVFNAIACGGFEVCDNAGRVKDFFDETELVTGSSPEEYFERVSYFIENPEKRTAYMVKALKKIYRHHTYHHRLADLLHQFFTGKPLSEFCRVLMN